MFIWGIGCRVRARWITKDASCRNNGSRPTAGNASTVRRLPYPSELLSCAPIRVAGRTAKFVAAGESLGREPAGVGAVAAPVGELGEAEREGPTGGIRPG